MGKGGRERGERERNEWRVSSGGVAVMSQCIVFCGRANSGPKLCGVKSDSIKWRREQKKIIFNWDG